MPFRLSIFLGAILIYGVFGSPTPAHLGLVEVIVACGLVALIAPVGALNAVIGGHRDLWARAGQALFFYGLSIPLLAGVMAGNNIVLIARDIIPFLFLLLPFFVVRWEDVLCAHIKAITACIAIAGLAFAIRVVVPVILNHDDFIGVGVDPLYLSIAPTVSFSAVLMGGVAGSMFYHGLRARNIFLALVLFVFAIIAVAAMVVTLQRAGVGLSLLGLGGLFMLSVWKKPANAVVPGILVLFFLIVFSPVILDVGSSLLHKNMVVGQNNRLQETAVVLDSVGVSPVSVFFGLGWGATLADPAVGGVVVNYTHNIFTTYLMKSGLCGVLLVGLYLGGLGISLLRVLRRNPVVAVALGVPLAINLTLYASFKSLDFGLILLLVSLWSQKLREARS